MKRDGGRALLCLLPLVSGTARLGRAAVRSVELLRAPLACRWHGPPPQAAMCWLCVAGSRILPGLHCSEGGCRCGRGSFAGSHSAPHGGGESVLSRAGREALLPHCISFSFSAWAAHS